MKKSIHWHIGRLESAITDIFADDLQNVKLEVESLQKQLLEAQQALDSAIESLEIVLYSGCLDGVVPTGIRGKIEAALASINISMNNSYKFPGYAPSLHKICDHKMILNHNQNTILCHKCQSAWEITHKQYESKK